MAQRPVWRGHLRLALVSCPIALYSVLRASRGLHFHLINPDTGHRVHMVTVDAETDQEVQRNKLIKGYEFEKDRFVLLDDADFEAARIESSSTITIDSFVPAASIEPIHYDTSYYLAPDGDAGVDVYAVLREAIVQSKRLALSRVVISRRERAIAIAPMSGRGLVAHTLHDAGELYDAQPVFSDVTDAKADPEMVKLATQLIERQSTRFNPAQMADRYEQRLREVIDAKLRGEGIEPAKGDEVTDRGNVIDLMATLRRSLEQRSQPGRPTTETSDQKPRAAAAKSSTPSTRREPAHSTTRKRRAG
jgi:DNA end-binding protein Ku